MTTMEWKEVYPEQSDWKKQIDIMAMAYYGSYGSQKIGSIILYDDERSWHCVINGNIDYLEAETEDEAKEEMIQRLDEHFTDEINYYQELRESLKNYEGDQKNERQIRY